VLFVSHADDGVVLTSRSLRCDVSYCAEAALDELRRLEGVSRSSRERGG
jgi:hypothetical protein